jgi:hypothetical protein
MFPWNVLERLLARIEAVHPSTLPADGRSIQESVECLADSDHVWVCPFATPRNEVLQRPVESALAAAIGVMHQSSATHRPAIIQGLLQGI